MTKLKINKNKIKYTDITTVDKNYTEKMNKEYNRMAKVYDTFMFIFPLWKKWITSVLPYIEGKKILEVSFGSGYLMTQYGEKNKYEITGIDYNEKMIELTKSKLKSSKINADLFQGNVEEMPFSDNSFDTVINTMAFTGYPDGEKALAEIKRVLKPGGKLLIVDFDFPKDRNVFGYSLVKFWEKCGDIIKDLNLLLNKYEFDFNDIPVGGFGSVHLFICTKN